MPWIKNCSACSEPMRSHALGGLAGIRQTLLRVHINKQSETCCHVTVIAERLNFDAENQKIE